MDRLILTLITGRSTRQGVGVSNGKSLPEYQEATNLMDMNRNDMEQVGLSDGDSVGLRTPFGSTKVQCRRGDLPEGLAFIPFGPACSRLIGDETYASGMPDSKHLRVELTKWIG